MQRQVRFNRVPEKEVPEKVPGGFVQRQVRFNRVPEKVPEKVWEALEQAEVFPALGLAARFKNICKKKHCGCWGYHRSLFLVRNARKTHFFYFPDELP